jgi:hypothetical protein
MTPIEGFFMLLSVIVFKWIYAALPKQTPKCLDPEPLKEATFDAPERPQAEMRQAQKHEEIASHTQATGRLEEGQGTSEKAAKNEAIQLMKVDRQGSDNTSEVIKLVVACAAIAMLASGASGEAGFVADIGRMAGLGLLALVIGVAVWSRWFK